MLPIDQLEWVDAEHLFRQLLEIVEGVETKLFGLAGQAQDGIDAYARRSAPPTDGGDGERVYAVLQSRRVKNLTAAKIKKAVDDLIAGDWADKTAVFYYATSCNLRRTQLDTEIRKQSERLAKLGIALVSWGAQEVSALLKDHPRLVDEFFGQSWVERFCGPQAVSDLANSKSVRVADRTGDSAVSPARTLKAFLAHHKWEGDDPEIRDGNVAAMAAFAESIQSLSRPARVMLALLLQRGRDLVGQVEIGATYAVEIQELMDVTTMTEQEVVSRVGQLIGRRFAKIEYEDMHFDSFVGPYVATRPHPGDLQWEDIVSYCRAHDVPIDKIFVDLRFDLLDDPTGSPTQQSPPELDAANR
ncbi:hypothetical protein [Herbidospora yilanensis]|uniref:hypothetical protein n=1 Tax=Herbidospora yilanensis TaxID=354426 RepID=UPI00078446AF|nr:hypothetical protein [Herbidospora yilanensis]